jgi:regulator of protease activity HflC (stomatin/prohibitin superfamily)
MRRDLQLLTVVQKASGLLLAFSTLCVAFAVYCYFGLQPIPLNAILIGVSCWCLLLSLNHWYGIKLALLDAREYRWQERKRTTSSGSNSWLQRANEEDSTQQIVFHERFPPFCRSGQWVLWVPLVSIWIWSLYEGWGNETPTTLLAESQLRLVATLSLLVGISSFLAVRYCRQLDMGEGRQWLATVSLPAQLVSWILILTGGVFFLVLFTGTDFIWWWSQILFWLLIVLIGDTLLVGLKPLFQPRDARTDALLQPLYGNTFLLQLLFQRTRASSKLLAGLEHILGVPLNELWFWRSLRRYLPPFFIAVFLLFWLSSAITVVPVGYQGIRVHMGDYQETPLEPGLHTSLPWPWGAIKLLPTQRIQQVVLGHETDLMKPILWAEKHYEGEINLLVGGGEELLTINMPVYYRITDPYRYLTNTRDAPEAITNLAYHYLLQHTVDLDAYELMSSERQKVADRIEQSLKESLSSYDLGIEIIEVALRDVHPPIEIANAYQEVVSAQEEQRTEIEKGYTYQAELLPTTQMEVYRIREEGFVGAVQRQEQATAETASIFELQPEYAANPTAFRHRFYLSSMESALQEPEKFILNRSNATSRFLIDFRNINQNKKP